MTPAEFISLHNSVQPDSTYFGRDEMRMFGDTVDNYQIIEHDTCFELARKQPVKYGLQTSHYFGRGTLNRVPSKETP